MNAPVTHNSHYEDPQAHVESHPSEFNSWSGALDEHAGMAHNANAVPFDVPVEGANLALPIHEIDHAGSGKPQQTTTMSDTFDNPIFGQYGK